MDKLESARERINEVDRKMAELWVERMNSVCEVSEYKREHGLPVIDTSREAAVIENNQKYVPEELRGLYADFLRDVMDVSKSYQRSAEFSSPDTVTLSLGDRSYNILIRRGELKNASEHMNLDRKVFVVTDDGVPP